MEAPFDSQHLLDSIIGLTEQRSQQSLESCLIDTMCELTKALHVALYAFGSDGESTVLTLSHYAHAPGHQPDNGKENQLLPPEIVLQNAAEEFRQCLEKQSVVNTPGHGKLGMRILYPVLGAEDRLTGLLAVDYPNLSATNHRLVNAFLRIHQNYQTLLSENQRDRLTGLLNRRTFDDQINRILEEQRAAALKPARRNDHYNYSLAILDIDHFKRINDTYGHLYGDEVLLLFAQIMKQTFRNEDLLFRFGGEEFIVLLKAPDTDTCMRILQRFRENVEKFSFPQVGHVTVSGGCVGISGSELQTTLLDHADQALYYAKNNGRNQIFRYEHLVEQGKLIPLSAEGSVDLF
jgi:diguanylate cyclase (GGDEF)-like protein